MVLREGMRTTIVAAALALLGCPAKEEPPPADQAAVLPDPPPPPREDALTLAVAWPERHEAVTISYVVIPGTHTPKTVEALWDIAKSERGARLRLVSGDGLQAPVPFPDATEGTACAVAKRDHQDVIGFDCRPIDRASLTLDPF